MNSIFKVHSYLSIAYCISYIRSDVFICNENQLKPYHLSHIHFSILIIDYSGSSDDIIIT